MKTSKSFSEVKTTVKKVAKTQCSVYDITICFT